MRVMNELESDRERQFMEYLRDGISAAKDGHHTLARSLLNRAIYLNGYDARPYIWLSSTTDDPAEQIEYLEKAVSLDPTNASARRGLAVLKGKIDQSKLYQTDAPEMTAGVGGVQAPAVPVSPIQVQAEIYLCPRCGGRMAFSMSSGTLTCEYCGFSEETGKAEGEVEGPLFSVADRAEQVLDFVMPTTLGHNWARAQQHLCCERCGAHSVLSPGQKTSQCPYCGSNQIVKASPQEELVDPQLISVMKFDKEQAARLVHKWLGKGAFSPDNLINSSATLELRPGYYSFWTFDGGVEIPWSCEVNMGTSKAPRWEPSHGVEARFFNDVLVPGIKAIKLQEQKALQPFDLHDVENLDPGYLAGWPAVLYDRSLSDASLVARDEVIREMRPQMYSLIEPGRDKRNVNIGGGEWSGMTFKHLLLPLWIGEYRFQSKKYRVLVNGQTGKVTGEKPSDTVKMVFVALLAFIVLAVILMLYLMLNARDAAF